MSSTESDTEDAITKKEITGEAPARSPAGTSKAAAEAPKAKNAFSELMKPKPKAPPLPAKPASAAARLFKDRDGLGAYTAAPETYPPSRVIYHDPDFVAINDLYPKATVHALLLPRSPAHDRLHPFDALDDAAFLAGVRAEAAKLRALVAKELRRRLGGTAARDWEDEVRVGIHMRPSMSHLHVHVFSRDMHSVCLKHRKHYNSFNTPFLVDLADFPLAEDDPRRNSRERYLDRSLRCWRCGQEFGNKFKALKDHLETEFEEWKRV